MAPLRGADLGWVAYPRVALPFGRLPGVTNVRPFGTFTIDYQVVEDKQNAFISNHEKADHGLQKPLMVSANWLVVSFFLVQCPKVQSPRSSYIIVFVLRFRSSFFVFVFVFSYTKTQSFYLFFYDAMWL